MNHTRQLQWAAALPGLGLVIAYAALGWLDPSHWLDGPAPPLSLSQPLAPRPARPQRSRADPRAPAPWPDEPAMRLQLSGRGLRLTGFQIGSQRMGAAQVRLTLQWQGPPGASLEMLQALALDTPQMVLDALVLQAESPAEWRVIWRGHWQQMTAPDPLPPRPPPIEGLGARGRARAFDPGALRRELARLWPQGQPTGAVLRLVRPEDLHWVALVHQPEPVAWLSWQQHTLAVRVGDPIGDAGARVVAIGADQVLISEAGRTHRLRPAVPEGPTGKAP